MMYTIYIVDDEKDLLNLVKKYLEKEGYNVRTFLNGENAMKAISDKVHLWLLDIMLGGDINGYDLIKQIKKENPIPTIFISARDQEFDRVIGLEMGSDDYITKPFSMREMLLRVNNVIKRVYGDKENNLIHYEPYKIDKIKRMIFFNTLPISLTSKETDMVLLLIENINVSFTRDQLLNKVWGDNYFGSDRVVDDLIKRVRKKMPKFNIETIYGYGYRLS
ncbi:MAG: response regulator transcription factor [Clostridiales bacterium]|nr:response regulator transcription factor [Clostridiales bacterium]